MIMFTKSSKRAYQSGSNQDSAMETASGSTSAISQHARTKMVCPKKSISSSLHQLKFATQTINFTLLPALTLTAPALPHITNTIVALAYISQFFDSMFFTQVSGSILATTFLNFRH